MPFWDNYLYYITFALIFTITIALQASNKINFIIKYQNTISIICALIQLGIFLQLTIYRLLQGGWFLILMTDLCPFLSFCSILVFFINQEKGYKIFMPWFFVGSMITILASSPDFTHEGFAMGFNSYLRHTILLIQGIFAYLWVNKYQKFEYFYIFFVPSLLITWVIFCALIPWRMTGNMKWAAFSSAFLPPAYTNETIWFGQNQDFQTHASYGIIKDLGIPYPLSMILFSIFAYGFANLIIFWKNKFEYLQGKIKKIINKTQRKTKNNPNT